ncbi:MAP kinase-activating death domain protein [Papilio xuthus]|uniref:MAP kinase-activating death domain protein n=1 Tax=Papilio xuthus TaxID=66420 RepID=A0A194Q977_PAPXU|nr:MAP kinase-activating death domain protein [Papilio xuthus]
MLQFFVRLDHIRKCFTQNGGIFVLEEFNPKTRQIIQRRYKSIMASTQLQFSASSADQICYAVLCVFSYFAAGQEQRKAILEQAARLPPTTPEPQVKPPGTPQAKPPGTPQAKPPGIPQAKPTASPQSGSRRSSTSDMPEPASPTIRATSQIEKSDSRIESRSTYKNNSGDGDFRITPEKQRTPPDRQHRNLSKQYTEQPRSSPERQEELRSTPSRGESGSPSRAEADRRGSVERRDLQEKAMAARTESLPPRRPPPPTPPAPLQQRLTRAHSQAAPLRPHDPPVDYDVVELQVPPRVSGTRPTGPPPALPPRQLSAAADLNTVPKSSSPVRRAPAQRQASVSAPFSATNPFSAPRHAEFVIPQRNNSRRPSTEHN